MNTIHMSIDIPDKTPIDVESLKRQVTAFVTAIITVPNILKKDAVKIEEKTTQYDMSFFDRFDCDWSDDTRDSHEIANELHDARVNERPNIEAW